MPPRIVQYEQSDTPPAQRVITPGTGVRLTLAQCVAIAIPLGGALVWCTTFYRNQEAQGDRIERIERLLRILAAKQGIEIP